MKLKRGIHRLYAEDPVSADRQLWGRKVDLVAGGPPDMAGHDSLDAGDAKPVAIRSCD